MAKAMDTIAWLRVPAEDDVLPAARELWDKPLEKLGFVPNVLRVMALRPQHLVARWAYMQELGRLRVESSRKAQLYDPSNDLRVRGFHG